MSKNPVLSVQLYSAPGEPAISEHEQKMRTLREEVMQNAAEVRPLPPAVDLEEVKALQQRLDAALFRTTKKEARLKALEFQLSLLKNEQEATFPLEQANRSLAFTMPSESVSQSEFNTTLMWDKKCRLEEALTALMRKMDAEALLSEQMSYLLQNTKESTKAARMKSDQLRYLQKRLLKRFDEIVTMHTRAENEYLHANHQTVKASEEADSDRFKRETALSTKRKLADLLRSEVERLCESVAKMQLEEQVIGTKEAETRRTKAATQLSAIEQMHKNVVSLQASTRTSVEKMKGSLDQLQRYRYSDFCLYLRWLRGTSTLQI